MLIYISMFFLSILFIYFANKQNDARRKNVLYVLSFMPFFLVSAFRYGVGTDYLRRYSLDFLKIYQGYSVDNLEIGFILLNKLTMLITNKPFLMFFITSFLINGFIFWTICKESKDKILSICIFFLLGFFFNSLNIMRQYFALSFIFIGFYYLLRNKKILFLLSVIIASFFHSSAFVMLALVICDYKVIANYKWSIPVVIVVLCLNSNLMEILEFVLKNTRFNVYFSGKLFKGEVSYLFILENLAFYLLMVYIQAKGYIQKGDKKANLYINTQALALLCMCLGTCHMLFIRIAFYFSAFQILGVPYFVNNFKKTYMICIKNNLYRFNIIKSLIIASMMVAFFITNIQSNVNEVVPYRTIFSCDKEIFTKNWRETQWREL